MRIDQQDETASDPTATDHACGALCRRQVLLGAGAVGAAAALAACGSTSTGAGGSTAAKKSPSSSASSSSSSSSSPATSSSSSSSESTTSSSAAGGKSLTSVSKIPVGSAVSATLPNKMPIVIAQPTKGKVVAFSAICTHMGCTVVPSGNEYKCPCHGSVYQAATGKNLSGPAPKPLPPVAVKVVKGQVFPA